jgi:hemerythrin
MKWQSHHTTGVPDIDTQHKVLIEASDGFRLTLEAGAGEKTYDLFLEFLDAYARTHFAYEKQRLLDRTRADARHNMYEHDDFFRVIAEARKCYEADGFSPKCAFDLVDRVDQLLVNHICQTDAHVKTSARDKA